MHGQSVRAICHVIAATTAYHRARHWNERHQLFS